MPTPREQDVLLWTKWHASRSQVDLEALMRHMMPVIRNEADQYAGTIRSTTVREGEAKMLALKAFETYDPNRVPPVLLSTHVVNGLLKLKRMGYQHQASVSVPEAQRITFNSITHARAQLEDVHGRQPTHDELADHLGLPPSYVTKVLHNVGRKEFLESGEGPAFQADVDDDVIHLAYHDMTPLQQQIFVLRTGYNHTTTPNPALILKGDAICKKLNINQGQLSYQIKKIEALLERAAELR